MIDFFKYTDHKYIFLDKISEMEDGCLSIQIDLCRTSTKEEEIKVSAMSIKAFPIEVDYDLPLVVIDFEDYTNYSVTNESYVDGDLTAEYEGRLFRIYSKSKYLDFIKTHTFADQMCEEEIRHYNVNCLDHIINIASFHEPKVYEVARKK